MRPSISLAVVVAGAMIALSIYFALGAGPRMHTMVGETPTIDIPLVTLQDHILGNPDAPIKIIEYSDFDCPFCKQFNITMKQIMATYGATGKVAWVYRHFPLQDLHPNAPKLAEASECVAEVGGNEAFWKFADAVFTSAPGNDRFDMNNLDSTIVRAGASPQEVERCITAGTYKKLIIEQFNDVTKAGGQGTPHNIIVTVSGRTIPIPGSQPFATLQSIIDTLLTE